MKGDGHCWVTLSLAGCHGCSDQGEGLGAESRESEVWVHGWTVVSGLRLVIGWMSPAGSW